jgi:cobalt-zinc-cadmium efflux system membrane fusion protein
VKLARFGSVAQRLLLAATCVCAGCGVQGSTDPAVTAPNTVIVDQEGDGESLHVDHPERFALTTATQVAAAPTLTVTGVVSPDVSRAVAVVSLASGRVVDLHVRLGDRVEKGQLLLRIHSADVAAAQTDYRKARTDEELARTQLERASDLFELGAIAKKDLEIARDLAAKAALDVESTAERLRVLGVDPANAAPSGLIDIMAPVSGVVSEQNVTTAAGVKTLDNSPNLLTISDLSHVWIVCDVYENDLPAVKVGDSAEIRFVAYPDKSLTGRISDISPILDPNIRSGKVRIEVINPGMLRVGMFVTAVFHEHSADVHAVVPAAAVLHLHDRDWVYVPAGNGRFQRREVISGSMHAGKLQELASGLPPGTQVVANALVLQSSLEQ